MARSLQASSISSSSSFLATPLRRLASTFIDYLNLTKPGILALLLISTVCPMVLASRGTVPVRLVLLALLGGALISASASVMNCIWDQDIDTLMERTKKRPLPAGRVAPGGAVAFAFVLGFAGVTILFYGLNPLSAYIALFGHFFYVVIYTIWLKRTTPQNIVIGGAAGAIPPIVGWAGVTGRVDLDSLLLFLIIFLWTPPHFWALALNKNEDYRRANVPMLPVVSGERATERQMWWYALSLLPVSLALVWHNPELGRFSLITLSVLGAIFVFKITQLRRMALDDAARTKKAWDIFGFSLIYLALFFACLVVDSTFL